MVEEIHQLGDPMSISVANVKLLPVPSTGSAASYEEMRGYDEVKFHDGFVSFTWYVNAGYSPIKERITYPMWRVLEVVETKE